MVLYLTLGRPEMTRKELSVEENCRQGKKKMVPNTGLVSSPCAAMTEDCVFCCPLSRN